MEASGDLSEAELAGIAAKNLWSLGIHPTLTLVAGESRVDRFRHPTPTTSLLGKKMMLVVCGRRQGLYANFTRNLYLREPTSTEKKVEISLREIESETFSAMRENLSLAEMYEKIQDAYNRGGYAKEVNMHHQGGPCGYLSREAIATPQSPKEHYVPGNQPVAYAWNPSLPGGKIEDTILRHPDGKVEILTVDKSWPMIDCDGYSRPLAWVRTS